MNACIERRSPLSRRVSGRRAMSVLVLTQIQTRARHGHGSSCSDKARGHSPEVPYHRAAHRQPPLVVVGDPRHARLDTPSTFSRPSPFPRAASRAAASDWSRAPHGRLAAFRAAPRFYRSVDATFLVLLFPSSPAMLPLPRAAPAAPLRFYRTRRHVLSQPVAIPRRDSSSAGTSIPRRPRRPFPRPRASLNLLPH